MKITHEIYLCTLNEPLDLTALNLECSKLKTSPFYCLEWRQLGKLVQLYPSGKLLCHGPLEVTERYLEILGKPLKELRLSTRSAMHDLGRSVDYYKLCKSMKGASYEPEYYHAALLKRGHVNFTIYHSGKICITGLISDDDMFDIVMPTILDLELLE
jgi:TATA-box binding protein (TBP) (component of TFIID and TFIIIB)